MKTIRLYFVAMAVTILALPVLASDFAPGYTPPDTGAATVTKLTAIQTAMTNGTHVVRPAKTITPVTATISCGTTATAFPTATPPAGRASLCIHNGSQETIYVGGPAVTTANGWPVAAGGQWCEDAGPVVYYCVAANAAAARTLEN